MKRAIFLKLFFLLPVLHSLSGEASLDPKYLATILNPPKTAAALLNFWEETAQDLYDAAAIDSFRGCCNKRISRHLLIPIIRVAYSAYRDPCEIIRSYTMDCQKHFLDQVRLLKASLFQPDFEQLAKIHLVEFQAFWTHRHEAFEIEMSRGQANIKLYPKTMTDFNKSASESFRELYSEYFRIWESTLLVTPLMPDAQPLSESPILEVLSNAKKTSPETLRALTDLKERCRQGSKMKIAKLSSLWTKLPRTHIAEEAGRTQFLFQYGYKTFQLGSYLAHESSQIQLDIQEQLGSQFPKEPTPFMLFAKSDSSPAAIEQRPIPLTFQTLMKNLTPQQTRTIVAFKGIHDEATDLTYTELKLLWEEIGLIENLDNKDCFHFKAGSQTFELGCYLPSSFDLKQMRDDLIRSGLNLKALRKLQRLHIKTSDPR